MDDFTALAQRLRRSSAMKSDYDVFFKFRDECRAISSIFDRHWDNIEELFTQAHLRELATPPTKEPRICDSIARVIWDVYRRPPEFSENHFRFAAYLQRLAVLWNIEGKERPIVITTNYDNHIESGFRRCKNDNTWYSVPPELHVEPPLQKQLLDKTRPDAPSLAQVNSYPRRVDDHGRHVEIIKVHGSVNWFRHRKVPDSGNVGGLAQAVEKIYIDRRWRGDPQRPCVECQDDDGAALYEDRWEPLIIPPGLGKVAVHSMLGEQWSRAIHALTFAREVNIIGYGFPATDIFMPRMLGEGVRQNEMLRTVRIINRDGSSTWRNRVSELFAKSWRQTKLQFFTRDGSFENFASEIDVPVTQEWDHVPKGGEKNLDVALFRHRLQAE